MASEPQRESRVTASADMDATWSSENTKNCTLIIAIHPLRVSLSVLQPSGRVINLRTDRPGTHPSEASPPDPYTIPFLVGLEEPFDFVYGSWAKHRWINKQKKPAFHLWQVGMALYGNCPLPKGQVVRHSDSLSSTVSVELLLAQFIRYVVSLVEGIQWDDRQNEEDLFKLKNHLIFVIPFSMPSLSRQRILNAVQVVGMTASLVNEGTLAAGIFFHVHPRVAGQGRKLLLFVEHSGNVDLYLFIGDDDGDMTMLSFTGNTHFFPENYNLDEIPELQEELQVFGQQFKKSYNKLGRGTDEGRRLLIWGLLRDLKLRMPRNIRPLYQKTLPFVCVAESAEWEKTIIEECNAYFGAFMLPCDDDEMAIPPQNGGVPKGSCSMLWHRNVNYTALFDDIASEKTHEQKAYDLVAVDYREDGRRLSRQDWQRRDQGLMQLNICPGTKKVILTESNIGTGKNFPIGFLTISSEVSNKDLKLEVKFIPKMDTYSWVGIWETDSVGNKIATLKAGKDYEWIFTEFTVQMVEKMQKELLAMNIYLDEKKAKAKRVEALLVEYENKLKGGVPISESVPSPSSQVALASKKKNKKKQGRMVKDVKALPGKYSENWEIISSIIRRVLKILDECPVTKLEEYIRDLEICIASFSM